MRSEELDVTRVFGAVDAMDVDAFLSFLTEDCEFRAGNGPPAIGHAEIGRAAGGLFSLLTGIRHSVLDVWCPAEAVVVRGEATYHRKSGGEVVLPFVDVFRVSGGKIEQYLIYCDLSPLLA